MQFLLKCKKGIKPSFLFNNFLYFCKRWQPSILEAARRTVSHASTHHLLSEQMRDGRTYPTQRAARALTTKLREITQTCSVTAQASHAFSQRECPPKFLLRPPLRYKSFLSNLSHRSIHHLLASPRSNKFALPRLTAPQRLAKGGCNTGPLRGVARSLKIEVMEPKHSALVHFSL
jgi:hypothetical protein